MLGLTTGPITGDAMPINPSIPLQIERPRFATPADMLSLQDLQTRAHANEFNLQNAQQMAPLQMEQLKQQTESGRLKSLADLAKLDKDKQDEEDKESLRMAAAIVSAPPPARPGIWKAVRTEAMRRGYKNIDQYPEQWDESMLPGFQAFVSGQLKPAEALERQDYPAEPETVQPDATQPAQVPLSEIPNFTGPQAVKLKPYSDENFAALQGLPAEEAGFQSRLAATRQGATPTITAVEPMPGETPDSIEAMARAIRARGGKVNYERYKDEMTRAQKLRENTWKEREQWESVPGAPGVTRNKITNEFLADGKTISAEKVQEIADRNRAAGASKQITNVNAYAPASEEAQKELMKSTRVTYDQLKQAPVMLDSIEKAIALVPGAKGFMGTGGETLLEATKFLNNRLGLSIATEGIKNAEELRTRIFFNILDNLKKMDAQPSQQQQLIMQESLGKLGTDPNALPSVLNAFADVLKGKIALHNEEVQSAIKTGVKFPYDPIIKLPKQIKRTGMLNGKKVIEYSDGSIEYAH